MLTFKGIQKTTLIDYPDHIACTLFLPKCNFACSYCYNPDLVLNKDLGTDISEEEALEFLKERKGFLEGVCITGGEPMLHYPAIVFFLEEVKKLGYKVKIDTNGSDPRPILQLVKKRLVDYIAMDIKGPLNKYAEITRKPVDPERIKESIKVIMGSNVDYEFRTTVFSFLTKDDFSEIGKLLSGAKIYYLQAGKADFPLLDKEFCAKEKIVTSEYLHEVAELLSPYFDKVKIRA